ncbi:MAG: hypothetical protein KGJ23_03605 [Euryarchaeota archaeon]|nr:hypothetical protein [Euryarchaeota archaeon]MDE1835686.1 hypothetical protein [Euryarchaeota archaeon]MDE1880452.1 hypothetical protein [Euryarchaeota archaeon]MDE2043876.1 hypothetical protein [Thermoplasmata archaeon]
MIAKKLRSGAPAPTSPSPTLRPFLLLGAVIALLVVSLLTPAVGVSRGSSTNYPPFSVSITGPSLLSLNGSGKFVAYAQGGPAERLNGSVVGNYTFTTQLVGADTAGSFVTPPSGAFIAQYVNATVGGINHTGTYTLEFNVTSHGVGHGAQNLTQVFSRQFQVVVPYIISATVENPNNFGVDGAVIQVALDGSVVGSLRVPSLLPAGSAQIKYNYTTLGLSSGYHTFTLTLVGGAGVLEFANGQPSMDVSFYVPAPAPDYTLYYLSGISVTVLAIFISLLFFGPRRPRRKKNP